LEAHGQPGAHSSNGEVRFDADHGVVRTRHTGIRDERGALGKQARIGGLNVSVRADDSSDLAVQPAGERSFLARRFGMRVDEDEGCGAAGFFDEVIDQLEHRGRWMEEQRAEHIDNRKTRAIG
jgi:hypothetical protein